MICRTVLLSVLVLLAWGAAGEGFVVVCPVSDLIDDGIAVVVERAVREAREADALVLEVDTPGGLIDAAIEISKSIGNARCQTIAYVKGMGAISAGALISYACDDIIMEPDTNIGAATPVVVGPQGMQPTGEKEVSFMRAKLRALAERNAHNPAIAEAMVDKDIELRSYLDPQGDWQIFAVYPDADVTPPDSAEVPEPAEVIRRALEALPPELEGVKELAEDFLPESDEPPAPSAVAPVEPDETGIILPKGKLLTLTPKEAVKYGVIPTTANNLTEVLAYYGHHGKEVRRIEMTLAERLFRFLTNPIVSGLLLMLGIGGLYFEVKTPGFGFPGTFGLICLALFFGAHVVLGVAEWLDILLVLTGLALLVVEVAVLPGFGIAGISGIVCLLLGLYMSLTKVTIPRYSWEFDRLGGALTSFLVTAVTLTVLVYLLSKILPRTPLHGLLVLTHAQAPSVGYVVQTAEEHDAAIGLQGVATSMLRPVGRGRFQGKSYQVVTRSEFIEKGTPIEIVQVDGNRYVVDRLNVEENA